VTKHITGIFGQQQYPRRNATALGDAWSGSTGPHRFSAAHGSTPPVMSSGSKAGETAPTAMKVAEGTVEVRNRLGVHIRPSMMLAKTAIKFLSAITIANGDKKVSARSASSLERLKAKTGTLLKVRAEGPDAGAALKAVEALFEKKFGED